MTDAKKSKSQTKVRMPFMFLIRAHLVSSVVDGVLCTYLSKAEKIGLKIIRNEPISMVKVANQGTSRMYAMTKSKYSIVTPFL